MFGAVVIASAASCFASIDERLLAKDAGVEGAAGDATGDVTADTTPDVSADAAPASDADASPDGGSCPVGMLRVHAPQDAGTYCIGVREVTLAEYDAFLDANPPTSLVPKACGWKPSFALPGWAQARAKDRPVTGVDWCDAYAYCKWSGGRLCGRIGGGSIRGGSSNDYQDPSQSEWYNACSKGGRQAYPYADTYDPRACNGEARDAGDLAPGGSFATCQGGFAGLFDLSGNVSEWEDGCYYPDDQADACAGLDGGICTTANCCDSCYVRGGTYKTSDPALLACRSNDNDPRDHRLDDLGIRCCAD